MDGLSEGTTAVAALVAYFKRATQYGVRPAEPFEFDDGVKPVRIDAMEFERLIDGLRDPKLRMRIEMLLAVGDFRFMKAAERRERFAREFDERLRWPAVSRSLYPAILEAAAEAVLGDTNQDWENCSLYWRVISVWPDEDRYRMRSTYEMTAEIGSILLAQSFDEELAESICDQYPEVMEVFTPMDQGHCEFRMFARTVGSHGPWMPLKHHRRRDLTEQFAEAGARARKSGTIFWESERFPETALYELRVECDWDLRLSWRYFSWSAPHRIWLRSFEADLSVLKPVIEDGRLALLRTTRDRVVAEVDSDRLLCRLDLNQVIEPGQTIRVDWTPN